MGPFLRFSLANSEGGQRSVGLRAKTDFLVAIHDGKSVAHCRAIELSATGVLLERARTIPIDDCEQLLRLELFIPGRDRPVRALARVVRVVGTRQALQFVSIYDHDRLTLMEHLDKKRAGR